MTDYTKLSKHEINKRVAAVRGIKVPKSGSPSLFGMPYNPAGAWRDCGPLIEEASITIQRRQAKVMEDWNAMIKGGEFMYADKCPKIAICICYLMSKEG